MEYATFKDEDNDMVNKISFDDEEERNKEFDIYLFPKNKINAENQYKAIINPSFLYKKRYCKKIIKIKSKKKKRKKYNINFI